jgi:hypothetical protein
MQTRHVVAGAVLAVLLSTGAGLTAYAHHAFAAEFDADAPVLLRGAVTTIEWYNPHTWIHIGDVEQQLGAGKPIKTTNHWMIEGGTPNTLLRTGITRDSLKAGTQVVVRGYQSKDALCSIHTKTKVKTCKANGRDVTFPNGCKLFVGSSGTGAPRDGSDATEGGNQNTCATASPT